MGRPRDELPYIEYTAKSGLVTRIYPDLWERESIKGPVMITEHAVEDGSHRTDHIRPEQVTGSVRIVFSDSPLRGDLDDKLKGKVEMIALPEYKYPKLTPLLSPAGLTGAVKSGVSAVASAIGLGGPAAPTHYSALKFQQPPARGRKVFATLMQLRAESTIFTVGFSIARVQNMGLANIEIARDESDGADIAIDLEFTQLSFVTTKSAKAIPIPLEPRGQVKKESVTISAADVPPGPKKTGLAAARDRITGG